MEICLLDDKWSKIQMSFSQLVKRNKSKETNQQRISCQEVWIPDSSTTKCPGFRQW